MEFLRKTILCPKCGRKVGEYDGRSQINQRRLCKKCNKMVVYKPEYGETELKEMPQRKSSSGITFI